MFPINYIDVKVPLQMLPIETTKTDASLLAKPPTSTLITAKALFNFTAEAPEDLTLRVTYYY